MNTFLTLADPPAYITPAIVNQLKPSKLDLALALESGGVYSRYTGAVTKFWMVDEHPDKLDTSKFKNLYYTQDKYRHGYHMSDGWVSYRGRCIGFPSVVESPYSVDKAKTERAKIFRRLSNDELLPIWGDIYEKPWREDMKYPYGEPTIIFVPYDTWFEMSDEDRWNYIRDINVDGWKYPYSMWKEFRDKADADFPKCNEQNCINLKKWRVDDYRIEEQRKIYIDHYNQFMTATQLVIPDWGLLMTTPMAFRYRNFYHSAMNTGIIPPHPALQPVSAIRKDYDEGWWNIA